MGQTDIQFKDNLCRDLITFKHLKELLDSDRKEDPAKANRPRNRAYQREFAGLRRCCHG